MNILNSQLLERGSTLFLKLVVLFLALAALAVCGLLLYVSVDSGPYLPLLIGVCLTSIPFFFGLYQAYLLLKYIDREEAFSPLSVYAITRIRNAAFVISAAYALGLPFIYIVAEMDDAPGIILIGMVLCAAPFVVAVFAAILKKLLQQAIHLKSEIDLTV